MLKTSTKSLLFFTLVSSLCMLSYLYNGDIVKVLDAINNSEASNISINIAITSCIIVRRKESGWFVGCGPITITVALSVAVTGSV